MLRNGILLLLPIATAHWASNLNYLSPSTQHPSLGISIPKITKRSSSVQQKWDPADLNFTHGTASGDPYAHSVLLWTRVAPTPDNDRSNITVSGYVPLYNHDTDEFVAVSTAPVCVEYRVARDKDVLEDDLALVDQGTVYTSSDIDYTVKVRLVGCTEIFCDFFLLIH